jgi:cytochrome c-type biogenesis protein CcmH/NrfG
MMGPITRWNDDRLDDLARRVNEHHLHLDRLDDLMITQAVFSTRLDDIAGDTGKCLLLLDEFKKDMAKHEIEVRKERITDRRWLIATSLTVAAIIVAAMGVFLG